MIFKEYDIPPIKISGGLAAKVLVLSQNLTFPSGTSSQDQALVFLQHQLGECASPILQTLVTALSQAQVQ